MNYQRIYNEIIKNRQKNIITSGYFEQHHILPKCLGGPNNQSNIVNLTAREHYTCHWLLTKIYSNDDIKYAKMLKAFYMMSIQSGNMYRQNITSKQYEKRRIDFQKAQKICQKGSRHNQFGTMWIFNRKLQRSKKIKKTDIIPIGWEKGRVINWNTSSNLIQRNIKRTRQCLQCKLTFTTTKHNKGICSQKCRYLYGYNTNPRMVLIEKLDKQKQIKNQNVPAYKASGWKVVQVD